MKDPTRMLYGAGLTGETESFRSALQYAGSEEDLLTRARILQCVRRDSGISQQDLAMRVGIAPATVNYHVRRLARDSQLVVQSAGRRRLIYLETQAPSPHHARAAGALRGRTCARVAWDILQHAGTTYDEVATRTQLPKRTVQYHAATLRALDLIEVVRSGRARALRGTRLLRALFVVSGPPGP